MKQTTGQKYKVRFSHRMVMLVLVATFAIFFFRVGVPFGVQAFVVNLFQPYGEKLEKVGFVEFQDGVMASVRKENESKFSKSDIVSAGSINKEFIFDFSWETRTIEEHGYAKGKWEWYAKAQALGEHAIVLEPWYGFTMFSILLSIFLAAFLTMMMPNSIGWMAVLFERQIENTKIKIRLQTGFPDGIVNMLIMPDNNLADYDRVEAEKIFRFVWDRTVTEGVGSGIQGVRFDEVFDDSVELVSFRNHSVYARIKEFFSDFVVKEIEDVKDGLIWRKNHLLFGKGLRIYMAHHFTEKYSNNVTGMAYGGAAVLIVAIGIRGLKLIPASRPSLILFAILLEFSMLVLMAVTLFYTEEEERMDRMLKKMEDASRSQLEIMRGQQYDIHQLTNALVGQTADIIKKRVEQSITEYMTSGDAMQSAIADEIGKKIMRSIKESYMDGTK
ncbi:MAG: hypothetical protein PF588_04520 [Candidatus Kapabacteria bacterium]|jgi:cell fate (sporulation/competence/biofilm development) regulator YlbF (YheA/YmcA/DUF963 family)|nr:hypothetical protein [Candidatus Kapabacteria bacterium]